MVNGVTRSIGAAVLVWAAITLVALPAWGQGDGDGDANGPAAGASRGSSAGGAPGAGDEDTPSAHGEGPERDDTSGASKGEPYAVDPYAADIPGDDAGIPAVLSRDEPSASAGEADDPSTGDPYATDPYDDSTE